MNVWGQAPVMNPMLPETDMLPNRDKVRVSAVGTLARAGTAPEAVT